MLGIADYSPNMYCNQDVFFLCYSTDSKCLAFSLSSDVQWQTLFSFQPTLSFFKSVIQMSSAWIRENSTISSRFENNRRGQMKPEQENSADVGRIGNLFSISRSAECNSLER